MKLLGRYLLFTGLLAVTSVAPFPALSDEIRPSILTLIVEEGTDVEKDPRVVEFAFDPGLASKKQWIIWKGSAGAGVLVFDPERKGTVESGAQIIGTWAFGGKDDGEKKVPWKDGYEALAHLDDDTDGKITGMELRGLGIWADRNRNGKCDVGEYKAIGLYGVTTLNLLPEQFDEKMGKRWSTRGFQYVKKGVTFTGFSVNWSTQVSSNEGELRAVVGALPTPCIQGDSGDDSKCPVENQQQNLGSIETHYR